MAILKEKNWSERRFEGNGEGEGGVWGSHVRRRWAVQMTTVDGVWDFNTRTLFHLFRRQIERAQKYMKS